MRKAIGSSPVSSGSGICFFPDTSPPRSSTPPTSPVLISSPIVKSSCPTLNPNNAVHRPTLDKGISIIEDKQGYHNKRGYTQYDLFLGEPEVHSGEVPSSPTKKRKTLKTSLNSPACSSEISNYFIERMLKLSRVTRRVIAAKVRYQCLRLIELELIKSINDDELEITRKELTATDLQIGSLRNELDDAGVLIAMLTFIYHTYESRNLLKPHCSVHNKHKATLHIDRAGEIDQAPSYQLPVRVHNLNYIRLAARLESNQLEPSNMLSPALQLHQDKRSHISMLTSPVIAGTRMVSGCYQWQGKYIERLTSLVLIPSSMPPRLVGHSHGTQPDPTSFETIPPFLAAPFRPDDVGQEGGLNERFAAAAAMMHTSQTGTSTENAEANDPYLQRCAKHGSRSSVKVTRQMTHYQQENQDVITTTRKLIIIDMITVHGWLTKVNKAVLHSVIRECINQGNAKHNRTLETTGDIIALVSQELSTVHGRLATISEAHAHHYALRPEISVSDEDDQRYMEHRRSVLYDTSRANYPNYFLHYRNPKTGELILFGHPTIRGTHLDGWYDNPLSPIYDELYRRKITTMPERMLMLSAASIRCGIDHHVEGRLSRSGSILSFEGSAYARVEQGIYDAFMAAKRMHPEMMEKFMYDLHQEGLAKMRKRLGISSPTKGLNIYVPSADDLSADRNSSRLEEAPSPGPSNYLRLEVLSAGPSTSSYPHFNQPPPSPFPQMGHLEAPYPDMPGSLDPHQQPPVEDEVPADPYYYPQDQGTQPSYLQPPMPGGYSTTSTGEDALEGFGEFENFAPGSWNASYY
ncbi:hypothetical protein C8R48DRAFT_671977 [Suillus tomentosus]|nr:hypothetical protein C8R48DRAFT_671977 [Suillus tomentosus]